MFSYLLFFFLLSFFNLSSPPATAHTDTVVTDRIHMLPVVASFPGSPLT